MLPRAWQAVLAEWRGVYLIADETDGKSYVGSAYGTDNILGRRMAYAVATRAASVSRSCSEPRRTWRSPT